MGYQRFKGSYVNCPKIKLNKKVVTGYRLWLTNGAVVEVDANKKQCILNDLQNGLIKKVRYLYE